MNKPSSVFVLSVLALLFFLFFSGSAAEFGNDDVLGASSHQRSLLQSNGNNGNYTLVLAEERTRRKDPSDNNNYYTGGWDIKNSHYLYSVAYTGYAFFIVAGVWFVVFGIILLLVAMYACCCRRKTYGYSKVAYALSLGLLCLFTAAAIIGSIVLYTGEGNFKSSTRSTFDFVVRQADDTSSSLKQVSSYLDSSKRIQVENQTLPQDMQNGIDSVNSLISTSADALHNATTNNKHYIYNGLDTVGLFLIIVAAIMLVVALLGFILSICGLQCLVYTLVVLGWILIAATFILCGVFLVLHNVVGDTCVAMNEWVDNPSAHTALSDIIPCVDPATAQEAFNQTRDVTIQMVQIVNGIVNISNIDFPPNPPPNIPPQLAYNQSGPYVPFLCNPYNQDGTNRTCVTGEVDLSNATQVWRNYECQVTNEICRTVGRLTPTMFDQMSNAVNLSYGLNHYGPFLTDLVDCTFVRNTFATISDEHCPDLTKFTKMVYIGLVMVSVAVMLSLILWVLYARERRHRKYTKLVDANSASADSTSLRYKGP